MIESPWKRAFMVLVGLAFVGIGGAAVVKLSGQDRIISLVVFIPFGLAILVCGLLRPTAPGDTDGIRVGSARVGGARRHGTWIRVPRARAIGAVVVCAGLAVASVGFAAYPDAWNENPVVVRLVGIGMALMCGAIAVAEARVLMRGGGGLLLTPEGLGSGPTWVPWDAVTGVSIMAFDDTEMLGVSVVNMSQVEASGLANLFSPLNRRHGADLTLPLDPLDIDGDLLLAALERLVDHPEDRPLLAEPGGARALRQLAGCAD